MPELEGRLASADIGAFTDAARDGLRKSAEHLLDQSRALPAPCGCNPRFRCDRHCRATIRPGRDAGGHRWWRLSCNGKGAMVAFNIHEPCSSISYSLPKLHTWAAEHVARHRLRAFARTE